MLPSFKESQMNKQHGFTLIELMVMINNELLFKQMK
ncbi:TPA: prepilin-type N-terminal cleavage/methylation domain-containing protein [Klebsiella pneumoniae]|nr:prepilin-type N-terminal cleavage/methylation domain-containing protein [Klebsiella pneumoniae]EKZ6053524.1 prepilin-type N-terminal cleavage/methylation domain-containing protein [Klebsiella variicola]MVX80871.1 prepilin-type N-terminal cleavage/methylation domain-containing protein [Enterobacteriaceae bacterium 8376wD9]MVY26861.1 prepilin-type N-terminal cleavage/methylation domain-containing protein [Enterobacteriaceae bacterium 8376wD8]HBQ6251603.1 prepilin-type N-terminal cleavage/methy